VGGSFCDPPRTVAPERPCGVVSAYQDHNHAKNVMHHWRACVHGYLCPMSSARPAPQVKAAVKKPPAQRFDHLLALTVSAKANSHWLHDNDVWGAGGECDKVGAALSLLPLSSLSLTHTLGRLPHTRTRTARKPSPSLLHRRTHTLDRTHTRAHSTTRTHAGGQGTGQGMEGLPEAQRRGPEDRRRVHAPRGPEVPARVCRQVQGERARAGLRVPVEVMMVEFLQSHFSGGHTFGSKAPAGSCEQSWRTCQSL
jgi:hypothetical protein